MSDDVYPDCRNLLATEASVENIHTSGILIHGRIRHKNDRRCDSPTKIRTMLTSVEPYPGPFSKLLSAIESPVTTTCGYNRFPGSTGVDPTGECGALAREPGQEVVRMYVRESNSKTPSPTVGAPGRVA